MTKDYKISGMTCADCQATVQKLLSNTEGVRKVSIDLPAGTASIEMDYHVSTERLQKALEAHPKYQLSGETVNGMSVSADAVENRKSWFETYKPILLIFFYIILVSGISAVSAGRFNFIIAMRIFMAGFFLVFSFFKLLDLTGFADSYSMYDIVAKKMKAWGFIYPFIELMLGIAYAANFLPLFTNSLTFFIMSVSLIGVLQSVLNKRKIKCACLGVVFKLPMSSITIIEDALMIAMSVVMLIIMN
jgi:copper chaperone CopZ